MCFCWNPTTLGPWTPPKGGVTLLVIIIMCTVDSVLDNFCCSVLNIGMHNFSPLDDHHCPTKHGLANMNLQGENFAHLPQGHLANKCKLNAFKATCQAKR